MKLWVDPAEGWKYGFPRIWDDEKYPSCVEWLKTCGYPHADRDWPVRMWPVADGDENK